MSAPWEELITIEQMSELYSEGIQRYGGDPSEPKPGCIESCLGAAWNAEAYQSDADRLNGLVFAGYLLFYLAKNHCHTDGNKRLAWTACVNVLLALHLTISATIDEAEALVMDVVSSHCDSMRVVQWLAEHVVAISPVLPDAAEAAASV